MTVRIGLVINFFKITIVLVLKHYDFWLEQRRFVLKSLKDFGFGKKSMEYLIMDEVHEMIKWMKENEGNPVSVKWSFSLATVNALWSITTGQRFDQNDPKLHEILNDMDQ